MESFKFYLIQDYNYLVTLTRCQAQIASKLEDPRLIRRILELALADVTTELENYNKLLTEVGLSLEEVMRARPSPTNRAYMDFLMTTCTLGTPLEGLVAILPCYWTYLEIAMHHREKLRENRVEIYRRWAHAYLTQEYHMIVQGLREIVDSHQHADPEKLDKLFRQASIYEYMFWSSLLTGV
jgi:thiaminase/transcriptional activator TenA